MNIFQASAESVRSRMADLAAAPSGSNGEATAALKLKLCGLANGSAIPGAGCSAPSPTGINNNHSRQGQESGGGGEQIKKQQRQQQQQQQQQLASDTNKYI